MKYLVAYRSVTARGDEVQGRAFLDLPEDLSVADVEDAEKEILRFLQHQGHAVSMVSTTNYVALRGER